MAHELATNAGKYGSLPAAHGHIEIKWCLIADGLLILRWIASGGPTVTPPTHRGFGTRIMENMSGQLRGEVRFDWREQGVTCEIALPLIAWSGFSIDWDDGHSTSIQQNDMGQVERVPREAN